ncbi:bifunctional glutamate N-acetyltransferase/amino-acid acetyltransferase ArgJ [Collibacillus ludicampi]|uniref:Arginine biosynthesis bifunctional protein ArgJ n=1 Tax=Collibacillus ludicampi TaxID=2771369 RepID=A0AAV4LCD0_9BACL|nr:bifunctional glutamate N-acetyltransferase/amino-acid acetyltransferase ArgJ [Collibacillus ludicampi]GIM45420.1 bifunctional glutamate N-acetyltransferase/amino-acid acetyltransferase ArgJ [Collibacillus ludicampi]
MEKTLQNLIRVNGGVTAAKGFRAAGIKAGIKAGRKDLGLIVSDVPAAAAGVFTTNVVRASCVTVTESVVKHSGVLQAVVANAGNANACTGKQGELDTLQMQQWTAEAIGIDSTLVGVASTGVIGVPLPMDKVSEGIRHAASMLHVTGGDDFAEAILTTDTCKKEIAVQVEIHGKTVTVGGVAKGSGMIHPNMATMLAFITTDAAVRADALQRALSQITDKTFNRITVDGDTSTNDMVLVMANGLAAHVLLVEEDPEWDRFVGALHTVCLHLAKAIARDGEGATKLIEVTVTGTRTESEAVQIAKTIVGSSLVKTAIYGTDANWGRIIAAAGRAGVSIDPGKIDVKLGSILVCQEGMGLAFDEDQAKSYLENETVSITVDLHQGDANATAYGCDLTYDYVKINASYRT